MNSNEHFRLKLAEVASKIQKEDLERLKFLCTDFIPDGDREKISSPEQLFIQLEHRRKLAPNRLAFLQKCLQQIGRHDLTYELNENAFEHHRKEGKNLNNFIASTAAELTVVLQTMDIQYTA